MKKNSWKAIICAIALVGTTGCDSFLTEDPQTSLFNTHVYADEQTAYTALVGAYAMFTAGNHYGQIWQVILPPSSIFITTGLDVLSTTLGASQKDIAEMGKYVYNANSGGPDKMYSGVYATLATINDVIYGIENSEIAQPGRDRLLGEARFLRGVCYFDVVRVWGEAPMPLSIATTIEEAHLGKSPVDEMFRTIIADFEFAELHMPKKDEQMKGKPFNYAATAFLAKVYAHMATSEYMFEGRVDPYSAEDRKGFWRKAYDYAKKVYDDRVYSLLPKYGDLWRCRTNSTQESIFELQFNRESGSNAWMWSMIPGQSTYTPKATSPNNASRVRASKVIYEWHKSRYSNPGIDEIDPRIGETYVVGEYYRNDLHNKPGSRVLVYPNTVSGDGELYPVPIKYCDPEWVSGGTSNMNWIVYRYADLLLLLAEAANEIGDPDNLKFSAVNEVLARARGTESSEPGDWQAEDYPDTDSFREAVMKERLYELPLEGHEWFDVRRRGKEWFKKMAVAYNEGVEQYTIAADTAEGKDRRVFIPTDDETVRKLMFLPIPYAELNNNRGLTPADQNYGY